MKKSIFAIIAAISFITLSAFAEEAKFTRDYNYGLRFYENEEYLNGNYRSNFVSIPQNRMLNYKDGFQWKVGVFELDGNTLYVGYSEDGRKKAYNIVKMPTKEMYQIRGKDITMIFQEPMTSLNPVFTIGYQLDEVSFIHTPSITKEEAKAHSIEMLNKVGISMPERVYKSYPHELSGGMRQRVMIAMALAGNPKLIIADEPTTALDVTIQAQILELLKDLQKKQGCSIMLITHDLGVIAEMADEVVVMYAGRVIEKGTAREIFHNPLHPYTIGLQKSKPLITSNSNEPLYSIPGQVPNPINLPNACYFKSRCSKCINKCNGEYPREIKVSDTHSVSCYLYEESEVGKDGE